MDSDFYNQHGAVVNFDSTRIGTRNYYVFAYNAGGAFAYYYWWYTVCGQETLGIYADYVSNPYQFEYSVDTTSGALQTIAWKIKHDEPFKSIYDISGQSFNVFYCYQQLDDGDFELRVYDSTTSDYTIDASNSAYISYDLTETSYPFNPRVYVSLETEQLLKTRVTVTTRGGI